MAGYTRIQNYFGEDSVQGFLDGNFACLIADDYDRMLRLREAASV